VAACLFAAAEWDTTKEAAAEVVLVGSEGKAEARLLQVKDDANGSELLPDLWLLTRFELRTTTPPVIRAVVPALLARARFVVPPCPPWSCCARRGVAVLTVLVVLALLVLLVVVVAVLAMLTLLLSCAVLIEDAHLFNEMAESVTIPILRARNHTYPVSMPNHVEHQS
jgi:hypothetical protein